MKTRLFLSLSLACALVAPAQAKDFPLAGESDRQDALQRTYDLLAGPSGQRLVATVTDAQEVALSAVGADRYLDWVTFAGRRLKMDKVWRYEEGRDCVGLEIDFRQLPLERTALMGFERMSLFDVLSYKESHAEIPALAGLTGVTSYGVQLVVDGELLSYRALALDYVGRDRPLLIEPMLWSLNVIADRLAKTELCAAPDAEAVFADGADAPTACTASTATYTTSQQSAQSTAGHNSTPPVKLCRGTATFRFTRTCATSCLLSHSATVYSSSCTTDDGYWNSFDDTDTDSATHGCSNSTGAACTADAAFHCVTRHCAFPCSATASVEWNGNGFSWGASDHLNAKLSWSHTPSRCN
jgi:hypothetical protein